MSHNDLDLDDRSARLIYGANVWASITPLLKGRTEINAAIAYIGNNGTELLPLQQSATIIVNASDAAIEQGSTNPSILLRWVLTGVKVYSLPDLHAKVVLAEGDPPFAVVGSANASRASTTRWQEAVLLADEAETVQELREALMEWRTIAGEPLTAAYLEEKSALFNTKPGGEDSYPLAQEPRKKPGNGTSWRRPWQIFLAPLISEGQPSEQAMQHLQRLMDKYEIPQDNSGADGEFQVDMFWWDEQPGLNAVPNPKYPPESHVIAIEASVTGRVTARAFVQAPGRVVYAYNDLQHHPPRRYYYLLVQICTPDRTFAELKEALASVGAKPEYTGSYIQDHKINAILALWPHARYTNRP